MRTDACMGTRLTVWCGILAPRRDQCDFAAVRCTLRHQLHNVAATRLYLKTVFLDPRRFCVPHWVGALCNDHCCPPVRRLSVCPVPDRMSRAEGHRKLKIGKEEAHE